ANRERPNSGAPGAAFPSCASGRDRSARSGWADSRDNPERDRAVGPDGSAAACALSRSFLCACIVEATERAGQKIDLKRLPPDLGVEVFHVRIRRRWISTIEDASVVFE